MIDSFITPFDRPDFEIVPAPASVLATRSDALCDAVGCRAPATHVARSRQADLACWLCAAHAERIRKLKGWA